MARHHREGPRATGAYSSGGRSTDKGNAICRVRSEAAETASRSAKLTFGMLRVMTYNIQFGGVDDDGTKVASRLPLIHEVVRRARPHVLAVQETNEFDLRDYRRMFAFERAVGMRSILVHSPHGFHGTMFLQPRLEPVSLRNDDPFGNRVLMGMVLRTPGGMDLTIHNVHLDTYAPQQRLDGILRRLSGPPSLVLGDFNNLRPDDPDAEHVWQALLPPYQTRFSGGAPLEGADGRVFWPSNKLDTLISSGTCIRLIVEPRSAQRVECASTLSLPRQTSLSGSHAAKFSMHRQPMRLPTTSPSSRSLISTDSPSHRQPTIAHRRRPSSTRTTLRGCWERPSGVAVDCRLPCHGCCSFGNRERLVSVCGLDRGQP